MHRTLLIPDLISRKGVRPFVSFLLLTSLALLGLLFEPGCLFRRHKPPPAAPVFPAPTRIALLPMNIPQGNTELRWVSLASTVLMAQVAQAAPDLEPVALWESMPTALQSLGDSRTITADIAELVATRLTARWATQGDLRPANDTLSLRIDFIPSRSILVPFRYEKGCSIDELDPHFRVAFDQFLRYLIVRPLMEENIQSLDAKKLKEVAEALDVEYGWFEPAKPGEAGKVVEDLAHANIDLARILFSPTLYPVLGK